MQTRRQHVGSCCRHAAALMLKIELWVSRYGKTELACTSGTNQWFTSRREVKAVRLSENCVRGGRTAAYCNQPEESIERRW
ncbi:hypothetical protein AMECASPLE_033814 [Ameca splendens]|uniref:Uncharacterized protein n=1 Tax=Ameca splendens TaxID=208324 RepID=A0ABV0ZSV6_9TELE